MRVVAILSLCFAVAAAVPTHPQRIVGGTETTVDNYPTIAALLYSIYGSTFMQACGGTIITKTAILTAAHCPEGDRANSWRVRVGSSYANSGGIVHHVTLITVHPDFNSEILDNDVAILRIADSIMYSNVVQPAYIAGSHYRLGDNEVVWAAGWGTTTNDGLLSEQLRHVQLWTINQDICRARHAKGGDKVTDNMLCSGWFDVGGRDQCEGDSGGPLYHDGVLVGICSWGAGCASAHYPGVNTRVSRFASWIRSNVN